MSLIEKCNIQHFWIYWAETVILKSRSGSPNTNVSSILSWYTCVSNMVTLGQLFPQVIERKRISLNGPLWHWKYFYITFRRIWGNAAIFCLCTADTELFWNFIWPWILTYFSLARLLMKIWHNLAYGQHI